MEIFRMDIPLSLIYFVCNFIFCACITWTKYNVQNNTFSGHVCTLSRGVLESSNVSGVLACGRMCYMTDKCLGYWYQPGTHQCFTFSDYLDQACVWSRKPKVNPGMFFYPEKNSTIGLFGIDLNGIRRENSYYFGLRFNLTFNQSVAYCNENSASIIQPETAEENKFLKELFVERDVLLTAVWLGITDIREEGTCELLSGQPLNYTDWRGQQSPTDSRSDNCAVYFIWGAGLDAEWAAIPCSSEGFLTLCEKR